MLDARIDNIYIYIYIYIYILYIYIYIYIVDIGILPSMLSRMDVLNQTLD